MRRELLTAAAVALTATALVSCGHGSEGSPPAAPSAFEERAAAVAAAWGRTDPTAYWGEDLVLLDDLAAPPVGVELTEEQDSAYSQGRYRLDAELPDTEPATTIDWADGSTDREPRSAEDAWAALATGGEPPADCGQTADPGASEDDPDGSTSSGTQSCGVLEVTEVTAGTAPRWTNHGLVDYPVWEFTVAGLAAPVTALAVVDEPGDPAAVTEEAELDEVYAASRLESVSDTEIGFAFVTGACVLDEAPLVYQTEDVVVVAGTARDDGTEICNDMAVYRPVTAGLTAPLGERMVIDAVTGKVLSADGGW